LAAEPEGLSPSVAHNFTARTSSALLMSLACLGIAGAVYFLVKRGY
jgi:hypothetical protein